MKYLWRLITRRCTRCGQRLRPKQCARERIEEINNMGRRLTKVLGRAPETQNCKKCHKLVFEGETSFEQRYLLIDMG